MKKITETKTEEFYCITKEQGKYLRDLLGGMSDLACAKMLDIPLSEFQESGLDELNYALYLELDEEFGDKE